MLKGPRWTFTPTLYRTYEATFGFFDRCKLLDRKRINLLAMHSRANVEKKGLSVSS